MRNKSCFQVEDTLEGASSIPEQSPCNVKPKWKDQCFEDTEARLPGFVFWLCHFLAPLCLDILICDTRTVTVSAS